MKSFLKKFFDIKFLKFILVGVINTIFGSAVMFLLYNLAFRNYHESSWAYWVSSAANYVLGSILSYFLNKYFTFKNREKGLKPALRFTLNIAVCYLLAYGIAKPLAGRILSGLDETVRTNAAMLTGMCLFVAFNYIGQRFFAFKEKAPAESEGDPAQDGAEK